MPSLPRPFPRLLGHSLAIPAASQVPHWPPFFGSYSPFSCKATTPERPSAEMDRHLPKKVQRMQDSAAELGQSEFVRAGSDKLIWPTVSYANAPRYPFNDLASPNVVCNQGNSGAQTSGFGGNLVNECLYSFGTTTAPIYGGGNYTAHDTFNGALSPLSGLTAPIGYYGQDNYISEDGTYGGLYPVDDLSAAGAVYDQGNSTGLAAYAGNVDHSLHRVENILAPNAVYNQGNHSGLAHNVGSVDEGFHPSDQVASASAIGLGSGNTGRYDPNAADIYGGLFPFTGFPPPNTAYQGANPGPQNAGFGPQALSLAPAVNSSIPSGATLGPRVDLQARSRPAGVDHRGRPRWACDRCGKTYGRPSDMQRHAKKHSGVLPYQCKVAGCGYRGSYRQEKLEQHRKNCH